jgi:class 3 adenylate cyclase
MLFAAADCRLWTPPAPDQLLRSATVSAPGPHNEGTLDQFSGDGIMVFFNDPVPCPDPAERAVSMAIAMREAAGKLIADWRERGRDLGFGAGIAQGYATLGQIGFSERSGYTAIGTVCNVAARLCAEAKDRDIVGAIETRTDRFHIAEESRGYDRHFRRRVHGEDAATRDRAAQEALGVAAIALPASSEAAADQRLPRLLASAMSP